MCGRFSIISNSKIISEHYDLVNTGEFTKSYNVTPSSNIPVVRLDDGARKIAICNWGLIPHWARDSKFKPINAKAETIAEKPFFKSSFKNKRCLIPANGFYEWKGKKGQKQPYYIKFEDDRLFSFAGIWDHWENGNKIIESCSIITTSANELMQPIHHRMPVILKPGDYDDWLKIGDKTLLKPFDEEMICYPVSTKINNPKNNGVDLVQPVN